MGKRITKIAMGTFLAVNVLTLNVEARTRGLMSLFDNPYFEVGYSYLINNEKLDHLEFKNTSLETEYNKRSLDDGHAGYGELGLKLNPNVSLGVNFLFALGNDLKVDRTLSGEATADTYRTKVRNTAVTLDLKYHFTEIYGFVPYVGVGVGVSRNQIKSEAIKRGTTDYTRAKKTSTEPAYNLGLGVRYMLTESTYINLSYKYMDFGKVKGPKKYTDGTTITDTTEAIRGKMTSHLIMAGVGVQF